MIARFACFRSNLYNMYKTSSLFRCLGLTICFFMLNNSYKSKKWYLSMHRLARSLTNQSCGPLPIWNGTLFSKMAPWCGQVKGHSLFDKKFFPIPVTHMQFWQQSAIQLCKREFVSISIWIFFVFSCINIMLSICYTAKGKNTTKTFWPMSRETNYFPLKQIQGFKTSS
jgi:hypothetical protein